jgi:hypothetical protein
MKKHWTDKVKVSRRFTNELKARHPGEVTNAEAYKVRIDTLPEKYLEIRRRGYVMRREHSGDIKYFKDTPREFELFLLQDEFLKMNVRNQLCKLEHLGELVRLSPGRYVWSLSLD